MCGSWAGLGLLSGWARWWSLAGLGRAGWALAAGGELGCGVAGLVGLRRAVLGQAEPGHWCGRAHTRYPKGGTHDQGSTIRHGLGS